MAKVSVNDTTLTSIADAIRTKNGLTTLYKPSEMAPAILAIVSGGGGEVEPGDGSLEDLVNNARYSLYIPASCADSDGVLYVDGKVGYDTPNIRGLEALEFGEGITKIVMTDVNPGWGSFANVGQDVEKGCKVTFPSTLKEINGILFANLNPKDNILELPEGLEVIEGNCFINMEYDTFIIPSTVKEIRGEAFEYSGEHIYFKGKPNYIGGYAFYRGTTETQYVYVPWSQEEGSFPHALYRKVTYDYYERENLEVTGDCSYRFSNNGWNWMFDEYLVTTRDVTSATNMFYGCNELEKIPFSINFSEYIGGTPSLQGMFQECNNLKELPPIYLTLPIPTYDNYMGISFIFGSCRQLREIPDDFFKNVPNTPGYWESKEANGARGTTTGFFGMNSLRKLPSYLLPWQNFNNSSKNVWESMYNQTLLDCYCLEEAHFPVELVEYTSNAFYNMFSNNYRLTHFTFETNEDGSPIAVNWSNQCIDIAYGCAGYASWSGQLVGYSGITEDKCVSDDATYQALKNDPDWYTDKKEYSRYNHDSAVETINSLPDCSAGSNNVIRFEGVCGSATDGGAISNLTADEIAVATAKGWTVEIV